MNTLPVLIPMPDGPDLLGLSRSALYRAAGEGRLKIVKLGKSSFIDRDTALAFIASLSTATIRRAPDRRRDAA